MSSRKYDPDHATPAAAAVLPLAQLSAQPSREAWTDLHFQALIENATDIAVVLDAQGLMRYGSPSVTRVLGYQRRELLDRSVTDLVHPDDAPQVWNAMRAVLATPGAEATVEVRFRHRDGEWRSLEAVARNLVHDPLIGGVVVNARDVTERRRAAQALVASDERFRLAFESSPIAMLLGTPQGQITRVNRAFGQLLGYDACEIARRGWSAITHPDDRERSHELHLAMERGDIEQYQQEKRYLHRDGSVVWVSLTASLVRDAEGVHVFVQIYDIRERKRAEEMLRVTQERFKLLGKATRDVVYDWDMESGTLYWSDNLATAFGLEPSTIRSETAWWAEQVHPDDLARVRQALQQAIDSCSSSWSDEYRFRRGDGSWAVVHERGHLVLGEEGKPVRMIGALADVTERKELESHLRQAQKMDAVGRLAGGIAHDFNNLLTVIASNCELILAEVPAQTSLASDVTEIWDAARRAAALTRQLLAFSRRQVLQPSVLDVNEVIADIEKMLRRVIGEDVSLRTALATNTGPVRADRNQLEQVLLNLAVNARDAMPNGGTVTIETRDVDVSAAMAARRAGFRAGPYVEIAVRDSGLGMTPEVLARIFEPFFTTKEVGKGTGLGLSTVYGIVKQSQGFVYADSSPGAGTVFSVYLPRVAAEASSDGSAEERVPPRERTPGARRALLLVEDEARVRAVVRRGLERRGFAVIEASCAEEAIALFDARQSEIDAVLSDVVMPGMNGYELAAELRARNDAIAILLMSGYPEHARSRAIPGVAPVLQKPLPAEELAERLRRAIDGEHVA